jgi:acetate kinase
VLDPGANDTNAEVISKASSPIRALVIPTDEEQVIADEALAVLRADRPSTGMKRNVVSLPQMEGDHP